MDTPFNKTIHRYPYEDEGLEHLEDKEKSKHKKNSRVTREGPHDDEYSSIGNGSFYSDEHYGELLDKHRPREL